MKDIDVCKLFFEQDPSDLLKYKCKVCSKVVKKGGSSYSNLGSHMRGQHAEQLQAATQARSIGQRTLDQSCFDVRVNEVYSWMELVVMENLPFTIVESTWMRSNVKFKATITRHSIADAVEATYEVVRKKVQEMLPPKFGLMFDGWSENGVHYVVSFAVFGDNDQRRELLLHFGTFRFEDSFTAEDHIDHFTDLMDSIQMNHAFMKVSLMNAV